MAEKEKTDKAEDVKLLVFSRETIEAQIGQSEIVIQDIRTQISNLQKDLEQNIGVLNYSKFLLAKYALPPKPVEPKPETPKVDPKLEVK